MHRWCTDRGAAHSTLTNAREIGNLGCMAWSSQRLDPDRRRRRLQLLAALADAKSARERAQPERLRGARIRELIANRRRLVN
jgi:hypothetical protein